MSFLTMKAELAESIPGASRIYAGTLINRAWGVVRDAHLWSFQIATSGFYSPPLVNGGRCTVQLGSPEIDGDSDAISAWSNSDFITSRQFRAGAAYSIYNIIGFDPDAGTLTLDRPYADPLPAFGGTYTIFQSLFPSPVPDFKRWLSVANMTTGRPIGIQSTLRDINRRDPMRIQGSEPAEIVAAGRDTRVGSSTLQYPMFELWSAPFTVQSFMATYIRKGLDLVANSDELPEPITEEVVLMKARQYLYEWAESRKDIMAAKGSGSDYLRLAAAAKAEFDSRLKTLRLIDREQMDLLVHQATPTFANTAYYNATTHRGNGGW